MLQLVHKIKKRKQVQSDDLKTISKNLIKNKKVVDK